MARHHTRLLILGSGPAGYTAAIYAARAMLEPVLIAGLQPGGQMTITTDVENYPGFPKAIQGPWLMEQMREQALHVGTRMISDTVVEADIGQSPFRLTLDGGDIWTCDALIIATGAQARWLGIPSEERFKGFGVSACATCDGFFFKGKDVLVVGGGNTAVEEALYLSHLAAKVTVIHRRGEFRAERIMRERLAARENVEVIWDTIAEKVEGDGEKGMTGLHLHNLVSQERKFLKADGLFIFVGFRPNTGVIAGHFDHDVMGYVLTDNAMMSSIPGLFVAGDLRAQLTRQVTTASGDATTAAIAADKYISRFKEMERNGSPSPTDGAIQSSHVSAGGYT